MVSRYPSVAWVEKAATGELNIKYPFHISEYAHSMGNALGNLADYWKAIESSNYICGGAIWDWVDQSIYHYTKDGRRYEGYGGDFGDYPNDGQFVMNGIIFADRKPKPQLAEVKKVYQEVAVSKYTPFLKEDIMSPPVFEIFNKNYFRTLSHLKGVWKLYKNGFEIKKGDFSIDAIPPQKRGIVNIGYLPTEVADYYINFEFELAEDMPWAKKGFVQAAEQLHWSENEVEKSPIASVAKGEKLTLSKDQKTLIGKDFSVQFDFEKGTIAKLQYGEQPIVENSNFQLNVFRAFVNNDVWAYQQWFNKGLHNLQHKALSHKVTKNANGSYSFAFTVQSQAPNGAQLVGKPSAADHRIEEFTNKPFDNDNFRFVTNQVFTVYPDGSIELQSAIASNEPTAVLPQIGYQLKLPKQFKYATYYGRGPQDNYSDRKTGAFVGIYNNEVTFPLPEGGSSFPKPQDMGHHQDTRWVALKNDDNKTGVLLVANPTMDFSALAHLPQQLTLA